MSEFIGRGKYKVEPDADGVDALLTGEISSITLDAGGVQRRAAGVAIRR